MFRPFGGNTSTFGSIPPSPQQPSGTGTSSFFGGGPTVPAFGSPNVPFQPHKDIENGMSVTIHSISAMPNYIGKSFEEVRLEDYAMGRKGRTSGFPSTAPVSSSFIGSGQPSSSTPFGTQPSTGPFGSSGMNFGNPPMGSTSMIGTGTSTGTSLFGPSQQQPTNMFGTPQTSLSGFGTSGGFGQTTNSIFGPNSGSGFGQQQQSTTPTVSSGFGPGLGGFGISNSMGSGFGQSNQPAASSSTSIFGQPPAQQQQIGSGFGTFPSTTPSTSTSGFGLFPSQQQAPAQPAPSGFGIGQTSAQSSLFPGFGAPKAASQTSSLFNPPAPMTGSSTGTSLFPSASTGASSTTAPTAVVSSGFDLFKPSQPMTATQPSGFGLGVGSSNMFQPKSSLFPTSSVPSSTCSGLFQPTSSQNVPSSLQQPSSLFKPAVTAPSVGTLPVIAPPPEILSIAPPLHPSLKNVSSTVKPAELKPASAFNPLPSTQAPIAITTQPSTNEIINIVPKIIGNLVPLGSKKISSKSDVKKLVITVSLQSEEAEDESRTNVPARIGDYYMEPSEAALRKLSPSQLAAVPNFVIGQTGVGEIRFLKPVDLTSVDLDRIFSHIVRFEPKQVVMYSDENKPTVGQGLNQPALIKLERCWPTQRGSRTLITDPENERMQQHIERLRNVPDTTFVSFDPTTGVWQFKVENF